MTFEISGILAPSFLFFIFYGNTKCSITKEDLRVLLYLRIQNSREMINSMSSSKENRSITYSTCRFPLL